MFARFRRRIGLIGLFAVALVSAAHGAPANSAPTENCLAAPNSTAPEGSHWFYRVDLQSAVKCWYLRMTGQTEQKTSAREQPATAAHAVAPHPTAAHTTVAHTSAPHAGNSHVQLIRRSSSSILGADSPESEASIGRDDGTSPAPTFVIDAPGGASKINMGALTGETFTRTTADRGPSPSIEVIRVRNSNESPLTDQTAAPRPNELPVGDQAAAPRAPVRVVWPAPVPEAQPAPVSKADAKEQTALLVLPDADEPASVGAESAPVPDKGTNGASRIGKLAVLIFLSFGLPGAAILAWLVMRADNARGGQFAPSGVRRREADDRRSGNDRRARGRDSRREADWLDDFLAHLDERPTTDVRNAAHPSRGAAQPRADVADVVLRDILLAFRRKAAAGNDARSRAANQRRMAVY